MKNDTQSSNQNLSEQSKYNDSEAPDVDFPQDLGAIIEAPGFLPHKSGYANLDYLRRLRKKVEKSRISSALSQVGLDLKRNDQVELCIHLPGGRTLCLPGAISNMKRERSTMLYRLGLETYPDPIAAAALSDYVANRSAEILQELETMYRTMCDAIA